LLQALVTQLRKALARDLHAKRPLTLRSVEAMLDQLCESD
jgi:hypothetical protein